MTANLTTRNEKSIASIREALRREFGSRQYRITRGGEIHVHGDMPNAIDDGWYLYGWIGDAATEARIFGECA